MKNLILLLICFLCFTAVTFSQVEQGDTELQFLGYIASGNDMSMGTIQALIGYYITPNLQIGMGAGVTIISSPVPNFNRDETTDTKVDLSSTIFGTYNFSTSNQLVPYLTATWYQNTYDIPDNQDFKDLSFVTVGGGIKYFLNEYAAVNSSLMYGFSLGNGSGIVLLFGGLSLFL